MGYADQAVSFLTPRYPGRLIAKKEEIPDRYTPRYAIPLQPHTQPKSPALLSPNGLTGRLARDVQTKNAVMSCSLLHST